MREHIEPGDVMTEAGHEGISERTLKRAKKELNVRSDKPQMNGGWEWSLPEEGQT
jgi:hypothetical protein